MIMFLGNDQLQNKTKTKHFRSLYHSAVPFRKCNCNDQVPHCVRIETFASQGLLHTHAHRAYTSSIGGGGTTSAEHVSLGERGSTRFPCWEQRIPRARQQRRQPAKSVLSCCGEERRATWSKSVREKEHQKESGECTCVCKDDSFNTRTIV